MAGNQERARGSGMVIPEIHILDFDWWVQNLAFKLTYLDKQFKISNPNLGFCYQNSDETLKSLGQMIVKF